MAIRGEGKQKKNHMIVRREKWTWKRSDLVKGQNDGSGSPGLL